MNFSCRLPSDPSWPKIPQRKLANSYTEIGHPTTCLPIKNRTNIRSLLRSDCKQINRSNATDHTDCSNNSHEKNSPKRRPGCCDPRFKKYTSTNNITTQFVYLIVYLLLE